MARRKPNVQHEAGAEPADEERGAGRARLLEAPSILMRDADDLHVPLADIAAHTGLNAALVRYYFKGKDGLLRALLERDTGTSLTELDHLLAMDIKPSKKLRYHLAGLINTYHTYPYLSRLMIKLLQEDPEIGGASILALQEVDRHKKRTGHNNTAKIIADALGMHYAWAAPPTANPSDEEETR